MKGEERVCHVTEADRLGAAKAVRLSEEVSSCEAAVLGVLPLCAAALRRLRRRSSEEDFLKRAPGIKRREGHLVDALALRGDEGRGTLRKARGRCERSLIPGSPNGATHPQGYPELNS